MPVVFFLQKAAEDQVFRCFLYASPMAARTSSSSSG